LLVVLNRLSPRILGEYAFEIYGALHAMTVAGALRQPRPVLAIGAFVIVGAVLSVGAFYLGLASGSLFGEALGVNAALAFGSAIGASTYALAVRLFWLPQLALSSVAIITAGCAMASLATIAVATALHFNDISILTLAWWWAFSALLWSQAARRWHLTMRWSGP
jgi:hypothetical protein